MTKKLAQHRKNQNDEHQQTLFKIVQCKDRDGLIFCTDTPTDSLYIMIAEMDGKETLDPLWQPKRLTDFGLPADDEKCPMIPMYDAFVSYIRILYEDCLLRMGGRGGYKINDFILHRAAFLFAMGLADDIPEPWHSPETFVEYCFRENPKYPWRKMLGQLKEVYERLGLGWCVDILKDGIVYAAETANAKYYGTKPRKELFPGKCNSRDYNDFKTGKRKEWVAQQKAKSENAVRSVVQNKLDMEEHLREKAKAEREKKVDQALRTLEQYKSAKPTYNDMDWDSVWAMMQPKRVQEMLSLLPSEEQAELLAMIPVNQCHRLGIIEQKRELINRRMKTA
jgi:hypothetical protein